MRRVAPVGVVAQTKGSMVAITKETILKAVEGKAAERGLQSERRGDLVVVSYDEPQTERQDDLHKQSIRSLVKRLAPDWKIHLNTVGELANARGFTVEVRLSPIADVGPVQGRSPKESSLEKAERLARELADELASLRRSG